ncbi:33 kDa inner dynein arm light chain, axonemal [Monocercomonoides exilis]|uniref:33 kDa inner dynein arm light chain, axonemal n=1 Tax=Monocercomonoides exilis TaxID=2049356 RepID=UPI00355A34B9|nr:33 kDa inner dynein arm light chain, axonemal [Monocercomonoides exilis]|eukprot:MONOS_12073.1-p1 / transcript=MONOS_12073.1 / gene=MONOS_12073 / organism=Monocercomonoides_exilis_PA203 / gene_product=33 kDa inner dynein arm light chain, axonemal / transcript_product=33 kDa inner dynein arm light chain, axonemal / location=Mono_scaffold00643:3457-4594(+) / protein_length=245 / sequence_SO=supercontig / SO=protein_coding / is_pseudo=false
MTALSSQLLPSLVKYEIPTLVSNTKDKKTAAAKSKSGASGDAKSQLAFTEEILNSILPPREFEEDGQRWIQKVSATPATRQDVEALNEALDRALVQRQARENGICPVRERLYDECFDELIRHVTISCSERGFLLLRVRDELRMRVAAYQTLYESSIAFGLRKALQAELGRTEQEEKISRLLQEKKELEKENAKLKARLEMVEKKEAERRAFEEKKHAEEIAYYQHQSQQLKAQLVQALGPQKKEK